MENGSLKSYLMAHETTLDEKLAFISDTSAGLDHVHSKGLLMMVVFDSERARTCQIGPRLVVRRLTHSSVPWPVLL